MQALLALKPNSWKVEREREREKEREREREGGRPKGRKDERKQERKQERKLTHSDGSLSMYALLNRVKGVSYTYRKDVKQVRCFESMDSACIDVCHSVSVNVSLKY